MFFEAPPTLKSFIFLCLTVFIITSAPAWSLPANAPEKISLQLRWTHQFQFAGYYAAKEQSYYADAGLDVEFIEHIINVNPIEQVLSGKAQYGISDSSIVIEFAKGTQIKALAAIFQHNPLVFITKQSSHITNPFEMKGKRIMLQNYDAAYAPLRACFLGAGFNEDNYISVKHSYDNGSLIRDEVDVISNYLTDAPYYFQQQGVEINIINPQDYGVDFYGDILFASTHETIEHADRAKRFRQATIKGWHYALAHQEELVQLIHNKYKSKLSLNALRYEAKEIAKLISADTIPLGTIKASRLLRTSDVYAQLHNTKKLNISDIRSFIQSDEDIHRITLSVQEQTWLHDHPHLNFTGDLDWLPYEAFDNNGKYIGIVADHLKLIEKYSGIKFNIIPTKTGQESVAKVRDGKIDIISETVNSSLTDIMVFTKPYLSSPIVIVMNDKQAYVNNIADISDKKIALIKGYGYIEDITDAYSEFNYHWVDTLQQGLEAVSSGKVDVLLSTLAQTSHAISKSAIQNVRIVGKTEFTNDIALGVKKEYAPVLIPLLNRVFDAIPESERKKIFDKWGKVEFAPQTNYRIVIQISIGLFLLLSIVLYWNRTLRKQIAARKQAESFLKVSEYRFSSLLEAIDAISVQGYDAERKVIFWNKASETIYGFTEQEALGKKLEDLIIPSNMRSGLIEAHDDWLESGIAIPSGELALLRKDGKLVDVFSSHVLQTNVTGEQEMFCIDIDLSDQKLAEEAFQISNKRFQTIFDEAPLGMAVIDSLTGHINDANPAYSRTVGRSIEELRSLSWMMITHADDVQADLDNMAEMNAGKTSGFSMKKRLFQPDGNIIWINMTIAPMKVKDKAKPHHLCIIEDITQQKHIDHDLRIAATAFESQEGIMVTDADNVILRVNKAFTEVTGYTAEDAIGNHPGMLASGRHDALFYNTMWQAINTSDYWEGEVWNKRKNGDVYPEKITITAVKDLTGTVTNYVCTLNDITLRKKAEQEIQDLAYYDPLTQLPNRRLMIDRIHHAMAASTRSGNEGALLFLDLDHFKTLNDTLGHDMGDILLQQVAERLRSCVREGDTISRFGGDEFVVLLEGLSTRRIEAAEQAENIANKILSSVNKPYQLASHHYTSSTSIGVTLFDAQQPKVEELLKQADIAMYQAKNDGRNALRFFDPQMQASITDRAKLEDELNQAIEQQQFQLYYQMQVDSSLRPLGAEALIRWIHPERGLISPLNFISVAEQNGAIVAIGQWVLDTACVQLNIWQQDALTRDLTLSVNVSAKQFRQADFIAQVIMTVQQHNINPAQLKLELTESLLLNDIEETIVKMKALAEIGIQFSLDDFGTGYSSLQYLKQLPLYQLKIDKSFVDDLVSDNSDQAIVRTIIAMAHSLGLSVIAEGVETKEQQQRLLTEGCTHYQGYLFGKPVSMTEFNKSLKEHSAQ